MTSPPAIVMRGASDSSAGFTMGCRVERDAPVGYARSVFDYPQNELRRFSATNII